MVREETEGEKMRKSQSDIYFCDCCGKIITCPASACLRNRDMNIAFINIVPTRKDAAGNREAIDLCPHCFERCLDGIKNEVFAFPDDWKSGSI